MVKLLTDIVIAVRDTQILSKLTNVLYKEVKKKLALLQVPIILVIMTGNKLSSGSEIIGT